MGVQKTPLTRKTFEEDLAAAGPGSVETSINPADFTINGQAVTSPHFQQGETVGQGTLTMERTVGKPTDDLSGIAATYTPTNAASDIDAYKQALLAAGSKYDITPQEVDAFVAKKKNRPLWKEEGNWQPGDQIEVPLGVLAEVGGDKVKIQNRAEQAQNYNPSPNLNVKLEKSITPEYLNEKLGPKGAALVGGFIGSGGRVAGTASGLLDFINDLSPTKGESMAKALDPNIKVVNPGTDLQEVFRDTSEAAQDVESKTGDGGYVSQVIKVAGAAPGDLSRLILLSQLPGGMISGMALDSAAQSRANNASGANIAKSAAKGAALGALFEVAPFVGRGANTAAATLANKAGSKLFEEGVTLGTIAGGTYGLAKASGDSNQDAFREAVVNGAFHLTNVIGATIKGKAIRVSDENGNQATVEVTPDGEVKTTDKVPEAQIFIPKSAEDFKNAKRTTEILKPEATNESDTETPSSSAPVAEAKSPEIPTQPAPVKRSVEVPTTEPEPEKTQFTSQLDEIRKKGAKTKAEIQALFPDAQLTREQAGDLRRQAWGETADTKQENSSEQVTGTTQEIGGTPTAKPNAAAPDIQTPAENRTVTHPDENINGKPVIAETADGRVVVPNAENKAGVSVVKDQSETKPDERESKTKAQPLSNTQVEFLPEQAKPFEKFRKDVIDPADVADKSVLPEYAKDGIHQIEPHITVKYGLHTNNHEDVIPSLKGEKPIEIELGKTSVFKGSEKKIPGTDKPIPYDVVTVAVKSPDLERLNKKLTEGQENTTTFPYSPHVTLAYVKSGMGEKYANRADFEGQKYTFDGVTFSPADKSGKSVIPLENNTATVRQDAIKAESESFH
jgi:2'-5' RNA ligase